MKILVSACLYGEICRYDGKSSSCVDERFIRWKNEGILVPVCPEVLGGLDTPRNPCELINGRAVSTKGVDCTEQYAKGAELALKLAKTHNVKCCILKSRSPSCGVNEIYDGSFSRKLTKGDGICAKKLKESGYLVFSEKDIDEIEKLIDE